ncbi:MAG TPA: hypothetical protein VMF33_00690 [Acidimicrobiales bacterium]|nr:hypothetical protein [Acidimicrobiales bacterium]
MAADYSDGVVSCDAEGVDIKGYYFPWGTKHVAYGEIHGLQRVSMGSLTGRWRIWGTANPTLWANFDPKRPKKRIGFILDADKRVRPFVTPDDPDAFESIVRERAHLGPGSGESTPSPFL